MAAEAGQDPADGIRDLWPSLADCQLLLLEHRRKTPEGRARAAAILDKLAWRHGDRLGAFAVLVPYNDCESIAHDLIPRGVGYFLVKPEDLVRDCERANKVAGLFQANLLASLNTQMALIRAYRLAEREHQALQAAEEWLRSFPKHCRAEIFLRRAAFMNIAGWCDFAIGIMARRSGWP